uniref:(northern house mosquito) hypothetical protein n=1 Tax=Culex pipiens TaxID=7175 RepID=A0A8D8FQJ0_CULPI
MNRRTVQINNQHQITLHRPLPPPQVPNLVQLHVSLAAVVPNHHIVRQIHPVGNLLLGPARLVLGGKVDGPPHVRLHQLPQILQELGPRVGPNLPRVVRLGNALALELQLHNAEAHPKQPVVRADLVILQRRSKVVDEGHHFFGFGCGHHQRVRIAIRFGWVVVMRTVCVEFAHFACLVVCGDLIANFCSNFQTFFAINTFIFSHFHFLNHFGLFTSFYFKFLSKIKPRFLGSFSVKALLQKIYCC